MHRRQQAGAVINGVDHHGDAMMFMAYTVLWAMPSEHIKGEAAAGGIALINTIGLSGGFWGPAMIGWAKTATGSANLGIVIVGCVFLCAALVILSTKPKTRDSAVPEYSAG